MISHFALIANIVQTAQHLRLADPTMPVERKLMQPGNAVHAGTCIYTWQAPGQPMMLTGRIYLVLPFYRTSSEFPSFAILRNS